MFRRSIILLSALVSLSLLAGCNNTTQKREIAPESPTSAVTPAPSASSSTEATPDTSVSSAGGEIQNGDAQVGEEATPECGTISTATSTFDKDGKEQGKLDANTPVSYSSSTADTNGRIEVRVQGTDTSVWVEKGAVKQADLCG